MVGSDPYEMMYSVDFEHIRSYMRLANWRYASGALPPTKDELWGMLSGLIRHCNRTLGEKAENGYPYPHMADCSSGGFEVHAMEWGDDREQFWSFGFNILKSKKDRI